MKPHVTLMLKDSQVSGFFLRAADIETETDSIKAVIGKIDFRDFDPYKMYTYTSREKASKEYNVAVKTSVERGWNVIYNGEVNYG